MRLLDDLVNGQCRFQAFAFNKEYGLRFYVPCENIDVSQVGAGWRSEFGHLDFYPLRWQDRREVGGNSFGEFMSLLVS